MNKIWNKAITYGRLNDALLSLGYRRQNTETYIAYFNDAYDSIIALPHAAPEEMVRPAHYVAVESEMRWRGILSEEAWYRFLLSRRPVARRAKIAKAVPAEAA